MARFLLIILLLVASVLMAPASASGDPKAAEPILRIYPNPATSFVTFDFQRGYEPGYSIQVLSFLGKKMYEATNINAKITLNLSDFNQGVYVYQLRNKAGKVIEYGKFQVSK